MSPDFGIYILALVAGLLLNLTPCVLPAIPLKIQVINRHAGNSPRQRFGSAMAFLSGTLTFFGGLAYLLSTLQLHWGFLFQSRTFLIVLVLVLLLAALAMLFDLGIPLPQALYRIGGKSLLEPFLAGLFTAILASPCTGPFLGAVLTYGLTRSTEVSIIMLLMVGMGLALPYLVLVMNPRWLPRLPQTGLWSLIVKDLLAFVLLAASAFFCQSLIAPPWDRLVWGLWLFLVCCRVCRAWLKESAIIRKAVPALFILLVMALLVWPPGETNEGDHLIAWQEFTPDRLEGLPRSGPILIEFTADWCINCKVLEATVYSSQALKEFIDQTDTLPLRVDLSQSDAMKEELLLRFGGRGLPYALVLDAEGTIVRKLPDIFTQDQLMSGLKEAAR